MLMFNNKLMAAKKLVDDGPADQQAESEMGESMVEAQKQAISALSKHEKLLLLELQRTRLNIVEELQELDPQLSSESWREVQGAIAQYQTKITKTATEESIEGQRVHGKFALPTRSSGSSKDEAVTTYGGSSNNRSRSPLKATTNKGSTGQLSLGAHGQSTEDLYQSLTNPGRKKVVAAAAAVPVSRLRTSVDMLPVLSSVGLNERDLSIKRQRPFALPTFKLPDIDPVRVQEVLRESDGVPASLQEKKIVERKIKGTNSSSPHDGDKSNGVYGSFSGKHGALAYTSTLLEKFAALGPVDLTFILGLIGMNHEDWGLVGDELASRVRMQVSCDTHDVFDETTPSVFLAALAVGGAIAEGGVVFAANSHSHYNEGGFGGLGESSQLTMGSNATTVGFAPSSSQSVGADRKGRSLMSRGSVHATDSLDTLSVFSRSSKAKSTASDKLTGKGKGSDKRSKMQQSVQLSRRTSELLKDELVGALRNMQHHTVGVKHGIASLKELVGIDGTNPRAKAIMHSVAAERMQGAVWLLVQRELRRGWLAWRLVNEQLRKRINNKKAVCVLGLRILSERLDLSVRGILDIKYTRWVNFTKRESARILRLKQLEGATEIQRHMRAYLARKRVRFIKEQIKYRKLYAAVIMIQALMRGRLVCWKYRKFVRVRLEERSALHVQRMFRGHRGRKRVKLIRFQRNKVRAATIIQSLIRGRFGRKRYTDKNKDRIKLRATVRMQAWIRGFLTRRKIAKILQNKREGSAAMVIQAIWRGGICRMSMGRRRKEIEEYKAVRFTAALNMQRVFRGWKSRLATMIKKVEAERKNRKLNIAAVKIQSIVRGFLGKCTVIQKKKEKMQQLLMDARSWKESWAEDAEAWYYLCEATGEDAWQPPSTGYTKADGSLVLATGVVIEDPTVLEEQEAERKKNSESVCCECEERVAIKFCNGCGDRYCTPCFRASHATGTRRKHTTEAIGPIECSECEIVLCVRWCVPCDEAFCDPCWRKVHSHGKRRFHPFCEVTSKGRVDPRQITMDGNEVPDFDATYAQQMVEAEQHNQSMVAAQAEYDEYAGQVAESAAEWETYEDEQGTPYYYNIQTGESTYDVPY